MIDVINVAPGPMNDGGPAFPNPHQPTPYQGMTLRDWFASQALPAFVNNSTFAAAAVVAYKFADAMLVERAKK